MPHVKISEVPEYEFVIQTPIFFPSSLFSQSVNLCSHKAFGFSPNLLPSQEAQLKSKKVQVDVNSAKLKQHTDILELLINNSEVMGFLTEEIEERYQTCLSMPTYQSQSDGELLEEETSCGAARRRVAKKKHTRRRSGSLSRVLSVMGKAIGLGRTPGNSKGDLQIYNKILSLMLRRKYFRSRVFRCALYPTAGFRRYACISFAERARRYFKTK